MLAFAVYMAVGLGAQCQVRFVVKLKVGARAHKSVI
jgi:hypothetical protein